jgi:adenine-specific DNA-methyltransferase
MNNPDKMRFQTPDITAENRKKLAELFPCVVAEGKVNIDLLRAYIGEEFFKDEAYEFTWVGKRAAIAQAGRPIRKTLRPVVADETTPTGQDSTGKPYCSSGSKNWDTTENLYIEGDNLDVLKLMLETYLGKVKMIYIDPPYNTGNDFIYRDDFARSREEYDEEAGAYDEDGDRLFRNTESNGRFHSDWCSMMYPRLVLARNLLRDNGVIFISIDDGEVAQLRKICDEVFGESNFVANVIWERAFSPVNLKKHFSESHDYIVCYAKDSNNLICNGLQRSEEANNRYSNPDNDPRGNWASADLSVGPAIENNIYEIVTPSGRSVMPPSGYSWRLNKTRFAEFLKDNRIYFGDDGNGVPRIKRFLSEVKQGITPMTIWKYQDVGHSQKASQDLKKLFNEKAVFTYPKPVELVKRLLELYTNNDSLILDRKSVV